MKVYPDANIYITYLLGQKGEDEVVQFFKQGISCRFSIVASDTMFAEVARRCGQNSIILLQKNVDEFKKAGKLELIHENPEIFEGAGPRINRETGKEYGLNHIIHTLLAKEHADVFVTSDGTLAEFCFEFCHRN